MNIQRLAKLRYKPWFFIPKVYLSSHTDTCPTVNKDSTPCGTNTSGNKPSGNQLKRALKSGKVRLCFVPEEWFVFFYPKTGVTGSYLFGIMLINYLVSKEKYVLEHEYHLGLSILVICYVATTKFGPILAASLDKGVDEVEKSFNDNRKEEENHYNNIIKEAKDAQWRAKGQNLLIEAKKENVSMQLEAVYRERLMQVYKRVKERLDYHARRHRAETLIHHKWMISWTLENVLKSITPEVEKKALDQAIANLTTLAERSK